MVLHVNAEKIDIKTEQLDTLEDIRQSKTIQVKTRTVLIHDTKVFKDRVQRSGSTYSER